jgi:hypothetical protein
MEIVAFYLNPRRNASEGAKTISYQLELSSRLVSQPLLK